MFSGGKREKFAYPARVSLHLLHRSVVLAPRKLQCPSVKKHVVFLLVSRRLAPRACLGFQNEYTARADQHVINIPFPIA